MTQIHLAESAAEIEAAARIIRGEIADVMAQAQAGEVIEAPERAHFRRDAAYCCALCVRAVDRLFEQSGASALYDGQPIQRAWRDIHTAAAHHSNRWDDAMQHFGRMAFGYGPSNPSFY